MSTLFISDLHLCEQQPNITQRFIDFCDQKARSARALYILGDLFEYWLGDDVIDPTAAKVQRVLKVLSDSGVAVSFMAGNRDFLLGEQYAGNCGMTILSEPTCVELMNQQVLLVHGDAECTDDVAYQQVRSVIRNPQWQENFLNKAVPERIAFAQEARKESQSHTQNSDMGIMDVNQEAIDGLMASVQVDFMIHGHTHRPAIHHWSDKTRVVLGDWHHQTNYLEVVENSYQLHMY